MEPVTFYTLKDIHIQVMDKFNHSAKLKEDTLYIQVAKVNDNKNRFAKESYSSPSIDDINKIRAWIQKDTCTKSLSIHKTPLDGGCVMVLTYNYIENTIKVSANTRVRHILEELPKILPVNENRSKSYKLCIDGETISIYGCKLAKCGYYDDGIDIAIPISDVDENNIFKQYQEPLLLQLDQFMDNR